MSATMWISSATQQKEPNKKISLYAVVFKVITNDHIEQFLLMHGDIFNPQG